MERRGGGGAGGGWGFMGGFRVSGLRFQGCGCRQ